MNRVKIILILVLYSCILHAQESANSKSGYNFGVLPAVSFSSDLGFQYGLLTNIYDYGDGSYYPKYKHSLYAEVSRYTKGSGIYRMFYDSEFLVPKIRLSAGLSYLPAQALDFYGFNGYDAIFNQNFEDENSSAYISRMYYKHQRNTFRSRIDLQGAFGSTNLNWVIGYSFINMDISSVPINELNENQDADRLLPDTALLYDNYVEWGVIGKAESDGGSHHNVKSGLTYDTRDNEPCPMSGIWSELVMFNSFGKEGNFGKISATHRQYFTLIPDDLSLAYRLSYQGTLWGNVPFYMTPYIVNSYSSSSSIDGVGGARTVRGIASNRLVARSMGYANIELRWKFWHFEFINQKWYAAVSPFMDFGRSLDKLNINTIGVPQEEFERHFAIGEEKMHITYGTGMHFSMNRNFIVTADVGVPIKEEDGELRIYIGMNWLF